MRRGWVVGPFTGGLALCVFVGLLWFWPHGPAKPTLADRINSACKPGYEVADWTTGDEYRPVPAGIVRVTCAHYDPMGGPVNQYDVAVTK